VKLKSMVVVGLPLLLLPQIASAQILSVKGTSANFRDKPSEAAKVKFSADRFYPVEVVEKKAGWVKVKDFEGDEAWVAERLLAKQPSVVISADKANIRERPNTTSDVSFKVERGEVFKLEDRKEHWLKVVDAHGDGGWIRDDMTWGEPGSDDKNATKDKLEKGDKVDGAKPSSASKAKEAKESDKGDKTEKPADVELSTKEGAVKVATNISEPENLETLCRSYLDDVQVKPVEKKHDKPVAAKPAQKKPAAKPAPKPAKPQKKK